MSDSSCKYIKSSGTKTNEECDKSVIESWDELRIACDSCSNCELCRNRTNVVFGRGNVDSNVMLVGEGPGADEDALGKPFVGRAGKLLDTLLCAIEIEQNDVYIANIVKCRPPQNRAPTIHEARTCLMYLRNQVYLQNPAIIVCMGNTASKYVLNSDIRITQVRGTWIEKKGVYIMPTYHPAAVLRDDMKKIPLWEDFKKVKLKMEELCQ